MKAASVATDDATSGSANQADQSMQDQTSPNIIVASNHLYGVLTAILHFPNLAL